MADDEGVGQGDLTDLGLDGDFDPERAISTIRKLRRRERDLESRVKELEGTNSELTSLNRFQGLQARYGSFLSPEDFKGLTDEADWEARAARLAELRGKTEGAPEGAQEPATPNPEEAELARSQELQAGAPGGGNGDAYSASQLVEFYRSGEKTPAQVAEMVRKGQMKPVGK